MNGTECNNVIKSLKWSEPANFLTFFVLLLLILLVISGNILVIAAVFCSNKLRSVTNYFIVNLAVADLLVGLAVLPFSATWEVFKVWLFGEIWCRIWLAVDVWMCTASILNLCAISLDRYVAVTRPVNYPNIMSKKRAKLLIAGIWVLSFIICFPPLVGWKEQKELSLFSTAVPWTEQLSNDFDMQRQKDLTNISNQLTKTLSAVNGNDPLYVSLDSEDVANKIVKKLFSAKPLCRPPRCELTSDRGYVVYSALGSFYIPMLVMLFFYWRIYRAAVRTTRAIKQGFKTTKGVPRELTNSRANDTQLVLRIHRGRPCNVSQRTPLSVHSMSSTLSVNSNCEDGSTTCSQPSTACHMNANRRATSMRVVRQRHEKVFIKVSYPSSENVLHLLGSSDMITATQDTTPPLTKDRKACLKTDLFEITNTAVNKDVDVERCVTSSMAESQRFIDTDLSEGSDRNSSANKKGGSKRSAKFQIKRFRMETKAAKTLAIIVGGFIICWLPFFTIYLVRPFCEECVAPTVFSFLFWLGYFNSAVNPMIYALFSHEFRIAFKRIICRCVCTRSGFRASENFHTIAARALMAPATFHKTISGCSDEDDVDVINFS